MCELLVDSLEILGGSAGSARTIETLGEIRLKAGECLWILAKEGVGVGILLDCLALRREPRTEDKTIVREFRVLGEDVFRLWEPARRSSLVGVQRQIGYVGQDSRLISFLTIRQNLEADLRAAGTPWTRTCDNTLARLRLKAGVGQFPDPRLGDDYQAAIVARALGKRPRALVLDHPTRGAIQLKRHRIWTAIIKAVEDGCALVAALTEEEFDLVWKIRAHKHEPPDLIWESKDHRPDNGGFKTRFGPRNTMPRPD